MATTTPTTAVGRRRQLPATGGPADPASPPLSGYYVFSPSLRVGGTLAVVASIPLWWWLVSPVRDERTYLTTVAVVATVYAVPGFVLGVMVSRRVTSRRDRLARRLWPLGLLHVAATFWVIQQHVVHGWQGIRGWNAPAVAVSLVIFVVIDAGLVRDRSGQRAAGIDAVDQLMATVAVTVPVALVTAEPIVTSEHSWLTTAVALTAVGAVHGIFLSLTLVARVDPADRAVMFMGLLLMVGTVVDCVAFIVLALDDFGRDPRPFALVHASTLGAAALFFLWANPGGRSHLERLPAQAQVRRRSTLSVLVLVAVPVIGVETWLRRDDAWVLATATVTALGLLALACLRQLLAARETIRLYAAVERAADERGRLLADVMGHVDADRHRVAAHLHRQAVALYTAMTGFTAALDAGGSMTPGAVAIAAERMRADLARQVDELRDVALAVEPLPRSGGGAHRLAALVRAHVENLYGDGERPALVVHVDDDLVLDWTTEAVVLRIVQEATHNVWRHAGAGGVRVVVGSEEGRLVVEVADDGVGLRGAPPARGIRSMETVAGFIGGDLTVASGERGGTCVRAEVAFAPPPRRRPHLRLVES